ncbi:endonuclease 4 [uncultured archaeon]|nr:endonuclease 4 [uncultured archaeon]
MTCCFQAVVIIAIDIQEMVSEAMVRLGVHISVAGGVERAVDRALEKGCDAFQIFTSNPRGWRTKPLTEEASQSFASHLKESGLFPVVDHMPYLPNLASPEEDVYLKSVQALATEVLRCRMLGIPYLVTHLGSHKGSGVEEGRSRIVRALQTALEAASGTVTILLENSAGTRNSMGSSFEDISAIIKSRELDGGHLGVCLDTCHLHAAGYDLRTPANLKDTMNRFAGCIDIERLKLIHLNDCRGTLGSGRDRHEHLGLGHIGEEGLRAVLNHPVCRDLPMILETPEDLRRDDIGNLDVARRLASGIK